MEDQEVGGGNRRQWGRQGEIESKQVNKYKLHIVISSIKQIEWVRQWSEWVRPRREGLSMSTVCRPTIFKV